MSRVADIHGFNNYEAMVLMDCFLRYIAPKNSLEIGTWDGKTSVIIANSTSDKFHFIECDKVHYDTTMKNVLERTNLTPAQVNGVLNLSYYTSFKQEYGKCMDFIHIDGAHSLEGVKYDLGISETIMTHRGIIVLDDVFSATYPQITQGVYEFLSHHSEFCLLLVGLNKGVICYNSMYVEYADFILDTLLDEMKRYPLLDTALFSICKTSGIADSLTYGIIGQDPKYDTHRYRGNEFLNGNAIERVLPDMTLN